MKTKWKVMAALLGAAGMAQAAYVTIGDPGNDPDGTGGYGAVGYTYKISATEVTIAEFQAATGAGDGNEDYWNDTDQGTSVGTDAPAVNISLYEAMKYCNYLTSGNVNNGVYVFSGGTYQSTYSRTDIMENGVLDSVATDPKKIYALPTEDEWYKAAYYTGNSGDLWSLYADGTDTVPTHGTTSGWNYYNSGYVNGDPNYTWTAGYGGEEQNATYDMMANVSEWMEDSTGVIRGGSYGNDAYHLRSSTRASRVPSYEIYDAGFRPVEVVPEPAVMGLIAIAGGFALIFRRRFAA